MESLTFKLEEFEGPLDLLLYLVGKNKMDLHEIAILDLIDQYTAVINTLTDHRLDVASEFIEMAARLVQMKSYLLLPRSEEAERLKQELTGQLIEYSACKEIAARMGTMAAATFGGAKAHGGGAGQHLPAAPRRIPFAAGVVRPDGPQPPQGRPQRRAL